MTVKNIMTNKSILRFLLQSVTLGILFSSTLTSCSMYPHFAKRKKLGVDELKVTGFKDYKSIGYGTTKLPKTLEKKARYAHGGAYANTYDFDVDKKYTSLVGQKELEDIEKFLYKKNDGTEFTLDLNLSRYSRFGQFVMLNFTNGREPDPKHYMFHYGHIDDITYDFILSLKTGKLYSLNEIGSGNDYIPNEYVIAHGDGVLFAETTVSIPNSKSWYNPTYVLYSETEEGLEVYDLKNLTSLVGVLSRIEDVAPDRFNYSFFDKYNNLYINNQYVYTYQRRAKKLESGVSVRLLLDKTPILIKDNEGDRQAYLLDKDLNKSLLEDFDFENTFYYYTQPMRYQWNVLYEDDNKIIFLYNYEDSLDFEDGVSDYDGQRYICYADLSDEKISVEKINLGYVESILYRGEGKLIYGNNRRIIEFDIFNKTPKIVFDAETMPEGFKERDWIRNFIPAFDDVYYVIIEDHETCERYTGYYENGVFTKEDIDSIYLDKMIEVIEEDEVEENENE